ncbi:hypothetical protein A8U91_00740 [Halomonas elongata]|uniref:Uncharacterized protein n=1 Tax=Halomonas elongata TaxID=2746 RepID=A0A1B8P2E4_HALEL|nr:hypothetical protein A8U91_00740 [Halomonas elongata]
MPYLCTMSWGTSSTISWLRPRLSKDATIPARSLLPFKSLSSTRTSGSSTAKGSSSPITGRAQSTAWPSPSGSDWRTLMMLTSEGTMARSSSSSSHLPLASRLASSSKCLSKWFSMALLLPCVTSTMSRIPASTASWTTYWITGRSTMVIISLGIALEAGRQRVPKPATGRTALRIMNRSLSCHGRMKSRSGMGMRSPERVSCTMIPNETAFATVASRRHPKRRGR